VIPKISVCCFVRDNDACGFGLWESMAQLMPFASEYVILDCGSTDGTYETLLSLAAMNDRIRVEQSTFYRADGSTDNKIFAERANDVIAMAKNDLVLYHQADEIFHESLLERLHIDLTRLAANGIPENWPGMNFWRYQLQENLQVVKWWPHSVNRLDRKDRLVHVGDGMNTNRPGDAPFVGDYGYCEWETVFKHFPPGLPTHHMILDISATGMFIDNILAKRRAHAPHWHENPDVLYGWMPGGINIHEFLEQQAQNDKWILRETPFNVPAIIKGLIGARAYHMRPEIFDMIANDKGLNHAA
jgi:hypothetical protein